MTDTKLLIPPLGRIYTAVAPFHRVAWIRPDGPRLACRFTAIRSCSQSGAGAFEASGSEGTARPPCRCVRAAG